MCLRHPLSSRNNSKLHKSTIQEYEEKWGKYEQDLIDDKITEIDDNNVCLEIECIYGYNTELLFHLLSSPRRKRLYHKSTNRPDLAAVHSRVLASMVVSGDHSPEDITKTLQMAYDFGYHISNWHGWNPVPYTNFEEFKSIIRTVANKIVVEMRKQGDKLNRDKLNLLMKKPEEFDD